MSWVCIRVIVCILHQPQPSLSHSLPLKWSFCPQIQTSNSSLHLCPFWLKVSVSVGFVLIQQPFHSPFIFSEQYKNQCLYLQKPLKYMLWFVMINQYPEVNFLGFWRLTCVDQYPEVKFVGFWRCITGLGNVGLESWGLCFICCCLYVFIGLLKKWLCLFLLMLSLRLFVLKISLALKLFTSMELNKR